jgi:hypothetical protein
MTRRQRFFSVALATAAIVAAAGCSGDAGGPSTLPPLTSTPGSTTSPEVTTTSPASPTSDPTPTTTLTLFDEHDASVDAFVQEFFAAYNAAQDSRDLSAFEALYLPQCTGCVQMRDELAAWLADGQTIEGGDWHILQQTCTAFPDHTRGDFAALIYRDRLSVHEESGSVALNVPQTPVQLAEGLVRPNPDWAAEGITIDEAPG